MTTLHQLFRLSHWVWHETIGMAREMKKGLVAGSLTLNLSTPFGSSSAEVHFRSTTLLIISVLSGRWRDPPGVCGRVRRREKEGGLSFGRDGMLFPERGRI